VRGGLGWLAASGHGRWSTSHHRCMHLGPCSRRQRWHGGHAMLRRHARSAGVTDCYLANKQCPTSPYIDKYCNNPLCEGVKVLGECPVRCPAS
jgi:hypothetical protein